MGITSFIIAILAGLGACVGTIPLLGWTLWLVLPVALIGLILGIIAVARTGGGKVWGWLGLLGNLATIIYGVVRLILGGGVI